MRRNQIITLFMIFVIFISASMVSADNGEDFNPDKDSGFYYTIQKGDTLWDLSEKFYQSQWDWPGLWEMNKKIKNPHWIYPGRKIRIFVKPVTPEQKPLTAPAPEKADPIQKVNPSFAYSKINRVGFMKKTSVPSLGSIIREQDGNLMMSTNDIIYINPQKPSALLPGHLYQIFTTRVVDEKIRGKRFKGIQHLIKADIVVLEAEKGYVTARITDSFKDANVGDQIMAYYHREPQLAVHENPDPIDAAIICSEDNTLMINDYAIAFINQGTDHHIRPGQIYSVRQENTSALDAFDRSGQALARHDIKLSPLTSGRLIVLHTEDIASTVMMISSKRDIHPGDMVR
ncbi:MAG: LysM peptidoglycan-binding domain-containing protein [Desulfobacteraceae bacterium]|nr:LysM peptidoglycan-binding domain-containing protein [Desulfobacteraceae bacterium]